MTKIFIVPNVTEKWADHPGDPLIHVTKGVPVEVSHSLAQAAVNARKAAYCVEGRIPASEIVKETTTGPKEKAEVKEKAPEKQESPWPKGPWSKAEA